MFILLMSCLVRGTKDTQTDPTDTQDLDTAESTDSGQTSAPPSVTVTLSPEAGHYLGETLSCTATASDPEDGALTPTLSWLLNNTNLPTAESELYINPNTMRVGDELACVATAMDSEGLESAASQTVLVEAKPILINAIEITDSDGDGEIHNDETVSCLVDIGDEADVEDFNVEWRLNEIQLLDEPYDELNLSLTEAMPGDTLECTVSVTNGDLGGSDMATVQITIGNRLPLAPTIGSILPANPRSDDDLLCDAEAIDPDGEVPQLNYQWTDGSANVSGATLSANYINGGDEWFCEVTASDVQGEGPMASVSVSILPDCESAEIGTFVLALGTGETMTLNLIQGCESPTGEYELTHAYYMMTTEVTQGMFMAVGFDNPVDSSTNYGYGDSYPAYNTSWHMAAIFANKMTEVHNNNYLTALQPCYSCTGTNLQTDTCTYAMDPNQCDGYSLPTAAEWEFAARSGTAQNFWHGIGPELGGNVFDQVGCGNGTSDTTILIDDESMNTAPLSNFAWFCGNAGDEAYNSTSKPVGLKQPNGFGLYDTVGNVSEWVTDDTDQDYPNGQVNPVSWGIEPNKLTMNGDWDSAAGSLTLNAYAWATADSEMVGNGFRLRRIIP